MAFTAMVEALARGERFRLFGDGSAARSFTYVGDAVAATIAAMERGRRGAVYNVGGGEEATMNEAIALLERISGRRARRRAGRGGRRRRAAHESGRERLPPISAGRRRRRCDDGLAAQWEWAAVESPA